MALEIEKKFLVHKDLLPDLGEGKTIIQGYLSEKPSVRYRVIDSTMVVTIKEYYGGGTRFELETPGKEITTEEIAKLLELSVCPPVLKSRSTLKHAGLIWEIDVYQKENEGLITVDVELPRPDYPLHFPEWVDKDREITQDSAYSNINLGRIPYTQWAQMNNS